MTNNAAAKRSFFTASWLRTMPSVNCAVVKG